MAMRRPRNARQAPSSRVNRSCPSNRISPACGTTLSGRSPIRAWAHIDFPEPDSPTTQRILPAVRSNETPSTANGRSPPGGSASFRSLMATALSADMSAAVLVEARVERIVEAFADQVQRQHRDQDGDPGKHGNPPGLANDGAAGADHVA